jgi:23S rRNA (cytosine1962-C5)-methyltransferase
LRLTATAESIVRGGHPWVFADSIKEQNREGEAGELAVIFDRNDKFLAVGFFDPNSPIRVRVVHAGKPTVIDDDFWSKRLDAAVRRRDGLFDEHTTGYRVINGESDGWPGLVLDRYDTTLVMKIYTAAWLERREVVAKLIRPRLNPHRIILRTSRNLASPPHVDSCGKVLYLEDSEEAGQGIPVIFSESGIRFEADVWRGQKTGFFLDQRENRRLIESLSAGRTVLNAFSFSGGFSLYAARGGAKSVTDLDISKHALDSAQRNFDLNTTNARIAACEHESVQADAFAWLAGNGGRQFDLIVLDPPSLAKRETERVGAIRAYARLAETGLKHLQPGGILLAGSCSAHVSAEEFFGAVREAARKSTRRFTEVRSTRHAPDHHANFPEAEYLKAIYLQF